MSIPTGGELMSKNVQLNVFFTLVGSCGIFVRYHRGSFLLLAFTFVSPTST